MCQQAATLSAINPVISVSGLELTHYPRMSADILLNQLKLFERDCYWEASND